MIKLILLVIRKVLGTHQILNEILTIQKKNQKQILMLNNAISTLLKERNEVVNSDVYIRLKELLILLKPINFQTRNLVRVGRNNDGGYVMHLNKSFEASKIAYSFGISNDVSWDYSMALYGKKVFMYDHTIDKLPYSNSNFNFFKVGLTGSKKSSDLKTLKQILDDNNHQDQSNIIMKIDIEDCEWDVLNETTSEILSQFSQIVIEFHNLSPYLNHSKFELVKRVLNKLNLTHYVVHIHANSDLSTSHMMLDLALPELLEVTYVRKIDINEEITENVNSYPMNIDEATFSNSPDLFLGRI